METGTRFVHTADWQIGLRANHVPGDHGAAVRLARYDTVKRIADVARDADAFPLTDDLARCARCVFRRPCGRTGG